MNKIFRDGTLVDVHVGYWSGAKNLSAEDLGLEEKNVAEAYKLGRKYLVPEEVIHAFRTIESRARNIVIKYSYNFPLGNARFVPKTKFSDVMKVLRECQAEYQGLVDDLVTNYEKHRLEMVPVYEQAALRAYETQEKTETAEFCFESKEDEKRAFVEKFMARIQTYYPTAESLREKFTLYWDVYEIAMPKMVKVEAEKLEQQEFARETFRTETQTKLDGFVREVVETLRQRTLEFCRDMTKNIKEGKVVKGRTITAFKNFIEEVPTMDFVGDKKLEEELATLKTEFLSLHDNETIKEQAVQDEFCQRLEAITKSVEDFTDIGGILDSYNNAEEPVEVAAA